MIKKCKLCDNEFETTKKKQRYCNECIKLKRIATNKKYYQSHKEKKKQYNKEYRSKFDNIVRHKISHYKDNDNKYGRGYNDDDYITEDWVKQALKICNNRCTYCEKELKLEKYEKQDPDMFSIDRKKAEKAHVIKPICNVVICCNKCNKKKSTKSFKDYIASLRPEKKI